MPRSLLIYLQYAHIGLIHQEILKGTWQNLWQLTYFYHLSVTLYRPSFHLQRFKQFGENAKQHTAVLLFFSFLSFCPNWIDFFIKYIFLYDYISFTHSRQIWQLTSMDSNTKTPFVTCAHTHAHTRTVTLDSINHLRPPIRIWICSLLAIRWKVRPILIGGRWPGVAANLVFRMEGGEEAVSLRPCDCVLNVPVCQFPGRHVSGGYLANKTHSKQIRHKSTSEHLSR